MQRVADTRLGPLLMLLGIPTALVGGLLNINWDNGQPQLSIDPARAAEIRNATQQEWQQLGNSGLGQTATELWNNYTNLGSNAPDAIQPPSGYGGFPQNQPAGFPSTSPRTATYGQSSYGQSSYGQNQARSTPGAYVSAQGYQPPGYQAQASPSDYHRNTPGGATYGSQSGYPQSTYTQSNNSQYPPSYQPTHPAYPTAQPYQSPNATQSPYNPFQQPNYPHNQTQSAGYQQPAYVPYQQSLQQSHQGQYQQPADSSHSYQPQYNQQQYNQQQYQYPSLDPSYSQSPWNNQQTRSNSYPQAYVGTPSMANPNSGWQVTQPQSPQSGYGQKPVYNPSHVASPNLNSHGRY
jgi:hypothetical protein